MELNPQRLRVKILIAEKGADFTYGVCPKCYQEYYPEYVKRKKDQKVKVNPQEARKR